MKYSSRSIIALMVLTTLSLIPFTAGTAQAGFQSSPWQTAYAEFLQLGKHFTTAEYETDTPNDYAPIAYALLDIDGNGVPELLIYNGSNNHAGNATYVYGLVSGVMVQQLGTVYGGPQADDVIWMSMNRGYPGIFLFNGGMGYYDTSYYTIQQSILTDELVSTSMFVPPESENLVETRQTQNEGLFQAARQRADIPFYSFEGVLSQLTGMAASGMSAPVVYAQPTPQIPQYYEKATITGGKTVNIRSGAGLNHPQVGDVYPGASFYYTGVSENGFYQILFPNVEYQQGYTTAYVMRDFVAISPVNPQDALLSSVLGTLKANPGAQIYLDAALSRRSQVQINTSDSVSYAGMSPTGSYAVLVPFVNEKGEAALALRFISGSDMTLETGYVTTPIEVYAPPVQPYTPAATPVPYAPAAPTMPPNDSPDVNG